MKPYQVTVVTETSIKTTSTYLVSWDKEEPMENLISSGDYNPIYSETKTTDKLEIAEIKELIYE